MTRKELSDLVCAELPKLQKRDSAYPAEIMLAQWACELTDKFGTPVVVLLAPSTITPGNVALIGYPVPVPSRSDGQG